ncbi:MAG: 2-oxoacid:acceptor oxidoreductase subunit alpha [Proteobacteria bacterium]|nr:2-oxoacid:acceptor oxidoreductase subunit alpha [Pseudomonadota bacterium]
MTYTDKFTSKIPLTVKRIALETVVIHFAGDSGDGMQLAGMQFTQSCATLGNDVRTYPDFPAEIRAPQGTLPGVSGFQLSFSELHIHTPGDKYDVLIAMNPAALKASLKNLKSGGILIIDEDKFTEKDLKKANFTDNPLTSESLSEFRVVRLPMTSLTLKALEEIDISRSSARKCKNMFALGVVYWLYHRNLEDTKTWIEERFKEAQAIKEANIVALRSGYHYAITAELFAEHYTVKAAKLASGEYRQITGNQALAWGCIAAAHQSGLPLVVCGYPITPASDILHLLAKYLQFGVKTFQAEDEIAAIGAAIGAAFGGALALTTTSGPGMDLKSEALGLAVMTELPLVVVDVQRAGPSTGMPTKVEQSDLLLSMFGRHGECPLPVLAPSTPGDCFYLILEAFRIATTYMTPVIVLSDAYLANSAEPWKIPDIGTLSEIPIQFHQSTNDAFLPYARKDNLARPWAVPGTKGLTHRIGGLEKEHETGNISYDPENHEKMVGMRAAKIAKIAQTLPAPTIIGDKFGKVLVISWGGTYGTTRAAIEQLQAKGYSISGLHLRYLNPFQEGLLELMQAFEQVVVAELNCGQLCHLLRSRYLIDAKAINKVQGKPFNISELQERLMPFLEN